MTRCQKGTRKNTKTGLCEKHIQSKKNTVKKEPKKIKSERKKCEKGSRKNTKTGLCEKFTVGIPIRPKGILGITSPYKLIIGNPSKYVITTESNTINNSPIFKFKHGKCIKHFQVIDKDINFKFLYLAYPFENKGILIKRNVDTDTPNIEKIIAFFKNIKFDPISKYKNFLEENHNFLTENNIITFIMHDASCEKKISILKANQKLAKLNKLLKKKCNNLSLSLDYVYNMNGHISSYSNDIYTLLLCLNHSTEGCISSIEVIPGDDGEVIINSKTKLEFEGKKYNKLLRAATIITAPLLGGETLNSIALNPISTWLLMNSFNATTSDEELIEFLYDKDVLPSAEPDQIITKDVFTKELIQEFYDDGGKVNLTLDLTNPKNIENAEKVYNELINTPTISKQIKCN